VTSLGLTVGLNLCLYRTTVAWGTDASVLLHHRVDGDRVDRRTRAELQLAL